MTFSDLFDTLPIEALSHQIPNFTDRDIQPLLRKSRWNLADFPKLISPAATPYIETMARLSTALTRQRFGHTMQMFIPMYLANYCYNKCTYCGFSIDNDYPRIALSSDEIVKEGLILKEKGFQHLLILTGEAPDKSGPDYIADAVKLLSPHFASIAIEVQPLKTEDYEAIIQAGADSLTVYQETYHKPTYLDHHVSGKKRNYTYRLDTPDRGGQAGFFKMNLGALLGLYEWHYEAIALAYHLNYLQKTYWKTKYAISFPRIQKMVGEFSPPYPVTDTDIVQFICAFRLVFPDLGITLSTREPAELRDHLIKLGITALSAESDTSPGGYSGKDSEKQFEISDTRRVEDIVAVLKKNNIEAVFKDWDGVLR